MKRYLVFYTSGKIVQQSMINDTFLNLLSIGIVSYIIDTGSGQMYLKSGKEVAQWYTIEEFTMGDSATEEKNDKKKANSA